MGNIIIKGLMEGTSPRSDIVKWLTEKIIIIKGLMERTSLRSEIFKGLTEKDYHRHRVDGKNFTKE